MRSTSPIKHETWAIAPKCSRCARLLLACIMGLLVCGCGMGCGSGTTGSAKKDVYFGVVVPLTGDVANYGEQTQQGIDLAIEEANQNSIKHMYRTIYEDSKGKGAEAVAAARKLIDVDRVVAIIGDNVSGPTVAMIPIADRARVPVISPSASSPKLSGMSEFFFRIYPSDTAEAAYMADVAAVRFKLKRVAILHVNNDFGIGLRDVFATRFTAKGGTVSEKLGYNEDETDFRPYLTKVKSSNPDGVYLAGYYRDGGSILKQARELGLAVRFLGATTHEDPQLLTIAHNAADGLVYPLSTGYDSNSKEEGAVRFREVFKKKYSKEPGLVAALGYDCAKLLVAAVENDGTDRQAIRAFLANTKDYPGVAGMITFDAKGDVHKTIRLKEVKDGKFQFLAAPVDGDKQ